MQGTFYLKLKNWLGDVFKTRTDIVVAFVIVIFILLNALKISLFNYYIIPNADKWMLRYKLLLTILLLIITYPILFKFKSRVLFVVFYLLQILYILVNLSYYLYFHNYLHIEQVLSNFYEGFTAVQNASSPKSPLLLVAMIDLPFFIYLAFRYFRVNRLKQKLKGVIVIAILCALCIMAFTEYGHYRENNSLYHIVKSMYSGEARIVQRYGTLVNNIVSIYQSSGTEELINSFNYGREQINETETATKPNIFILQVESMDAAVVNHKYGDSFVMPYMNSLTKGSVYYPYMLSYHMGGGTSDSEFSIVNSLEPLVGYPSIKLTAYNSPNSFISRLAQAAYEVNAFHGNTGRFYNRDVAFHKYGFKEFYDIVKMGMRDVGWGAPDTQVFDYALEKSRMAQNPFLTYIITMSSHGPFTNVSNYYNNKAYNDIEDSTVRNYFNSMSYVDDSIKTFVQSVKEEYDNAYIYIFGDHTPNIKSGLFKQSSFTQDGKFFEFVPLFVITPDNRVYSEQKIAASFLDIAPTVLYASGIPFSIKSDGADLLNPGGNVDNIPYRGTEYDRTDLFNKITEELKK